MSGLISQSAGVTASLTKLGGGTLVLSNAANTYTGVTTAGGGTLSVPTLLNGGLISSIGASSNAPANLVLSGNGILAYTGAAATTESRLHRWRGRRRHRQRQRSDVQRPSGPGKRHSRFLHQEQRGHAELYECHRHQHVHRRRGWATASASWLTAASRCSAARPPRPSRRRTRSMANSLSARSTRRLRPARRWTSTAARPPSPITSG